MRRFLLYPLAATYFLVVVLIPAPAAWAMDRLIPSALDIFRILPTSVFENTPEGLSDEEKQALINRGHTSLWRLLPIGTDELRIESRPIAGSEVTIRLFHEQNASVAAVGAESRDSCAVELWRYDAQGRLVPYPLPPEPALADFFAPVAAPKGLTSSVLFCLSGTVLRAYPLLAGAQGEESQVQAHNAVFYRWTGAGFEKASIPLSSLTPETAPSQKEDAAP